jgi:hypothetical protein
MVLHHIQKSRHHRPTDCLTHQESTRMCQFPCTATGDTCCLASRQLPSCVQHKPTAAVVPGNANWTGHYTAVSTLMEHTRQGAMHTSRVLDWPAAITDQALDGPLAGPQQRLVQHTATLSCLPPLIGTLMEPAHSQAEQHPASCECTAGKGRRVSISRWGLASAGAASHLHSFIPQACRAHRGLYGGTIALHPLMTNSQTHGKQLTANSQQC